MVFFIDWLVKTVRIVVSSSNAEECNTVISFYHGWGYVIKRVSRRSKTCRPLQKGQDDGSSCFKDDINGCFGNLSFCGRWSPITPSDMLDGKHAEHALRCHTKIILEGCDLKSAAAFKFGAGWAGMTSCLGLMKVRHLVMSVMSWNRIVRIAVETVISEVQHWVQPIWRLRRNRIAVWSYSSIELKVSHMVILFLTMNGEVNQRSRSSSGTPNRTLIEHLIQIFLCALPLIILFHYKYLKSYTFCTEQSSYSTTFLFTIFRNM